ncbi:tRNA uridine-5-carboxymethylaminomethyl(34) synthesis GTPase MnmE [Tsuneonella amylolytica]|uniref:tRNA uridine-5-carboxymethylaminomethyl(34) synthesis GTPase MnmE n=1 Tax=Tsuneonella amylolytica TaxID=2338327 RepID=UPI000EAA7803|nr:tRNA uridine-5-carboxymethylaminomethyl(34) synthesis GTPase MnmE [Tsuneonella amylolytica]
MDTIFALSSGSPPAGIAVVRVTGPRASAALETLAGRLPAARRATAATLRGDDGEVLDRALVLWLPGPGTATGEDTAELHLHGGRAVVAAVETALAAIPGLRRAEAGEFTRRAFVNGRIDLSEAEGLADLLSAETELQRRAAIAMADGALSRLVEGWRERLLHLSAMVEAALDFDDEDDVGELPSGFGDSVSALLGEIRTWLDRPCAEALKEGFRVVLGGSPNAGKSSLFNALLENEAAIISPTPGTTRDVLERSVSIAGVAFTLVDTAGVRGETPDEIEALGIARAREQFARGDLVLWLGPEGEGPRDAWEIDAKVDATGDRKSCPKVRVSALSGQGLDELKLRLVDEARLALPRPGEAALNKRQHDLLGDAFESLIDCRANTDLLLVAENLRMARVAFDKLIGRASTEDMLDTLFGRFCIGK